MFVLNAGIIQHGDKEPIKTMPYDGLNWIGLIGLFGVVRNKNRRLLIEDIGDTAQKINDLFTEFDYVRTLVQHNKVMAKAVKLRFGSYKNISIIQFLANCEHKRIANEIVYRDFVESVKRYGAKNV